MAKERFINARTRRRGFTTVLNQMLDDPTLSLEAKGLLTILLSNKDDWRINMKEIIARSKNGRDAHYRVIKELIEAGYFYRIQVKEKGKFKEIIYIFSDNKDDVTEEVKELEKQGLLPHPENQETVSVSPLPENPETENPETENPDTDFQDNNNTNTKNTNTNNTNTSMYVGSESPEHEEQTKPEETKALQMCVIDRFVSAYKLTGYARKNLIELMEIHGDLVAEALERAINSETEKPIAYIKGILKKWSMADVKTVEDIHTYESNFRKKQQQQQKQKQPKQKKQPTKQNDLPESIRKQEEEKQKEHEKDESWKQKEAELREKIRLMNERFKGQNPPAY